MSTRPVHVDVRRSEEDDRDVATYEVDTSLYSREALFRACYLFTDRCYLFLRQLENGNIAVDFRGQETATRLEHVVGAFANELINQRLRADISRETQSIRELIVAQAFAEAQFDGRSR